MKNVPKKTWIAQVTDDLHTLHLTINNEKQASKNNNQWHAIAWDVIPLASTARQSLPYHCYKSLLVKVSSICV